MVLLASDNCKSLTLGHLKIRCLGEELELISEGEGTLKESFVLKSLSLVLYSAVS